MKKDLSKYISVAKQLGFELPYTEKVRNLGVAEQKLVGF